MLPYSELSPFAKMAWLKDPHRVPPIDDVVRSTCAWAMWLTSSGNHGGAQLALDKLMLYCLQYQNRTEQQQQSTAPPIPALQHSNAALFPSSTATSDQRSVLRLPPEREALRKQIERQLQRSEVPLRSLQPPLLLPTVAAAAHTMTTTTTPHRREENSLLLGTLSPSPVVGSDSAERSSLLSQGSFPFSPPPLPAVVVGDQVPRRPLLDDALVVRSQSSLSSPVESMVLRETSANNTATTDTSGILPSPPLRTHSVFDDGDEDDEEENPTQSGRPSLCLPSPVTTTDSSLHTLRTRGMPRQDEDTAVLSRKRQRSLSSSTTSSEDEPTATERLARDGAEDEVRRFADPDEPISPVVKNHPAALLHQSKSIELSPQSIHADEGDETANSEPVQGQPLSDSPPPTCLRYEEDSPSVAERTTPPPSQCRPPLSPPPPAAAMERTATTSTEATPKKDLQPASSHLPHQHHATSARPIPEELKRVAQDDEEEADVHEKEGRVERGAPRSKMVVEAGPPPPSALPSRSTGPAIRGRGARGGRGGSIAEQTAAGSPPPSAAGERAMPTFDLPGQQVAVVEGTLRSRPVVSVASEHSMVVARPRRGAAASSKIAALLQNEKHTSLFDLPSTSPAPPASSSTAGGRPKTPPPPQSTTKRPHPPPPK